MYLSCCKIDLHTTIQHRDLSHDLFAESEDFQFPEHAFEE